VATILTILLRVIGPYFALFIQ